MKIQSSRKLGKRAKRGIAVMRIIAKAIADKPTFTVQDLETAFEGTLYHDLTRLQLGHYIALLQRLGAPIKTERVRVKNILDDQDICFRSDARLYRLIGDSGQVMVAVDDLEARPN